MIDFKALIVVTFFRALERGGILGPPGGGGCLGLASEIGKID